MIGVDGYRKFLASKAPVAAAQGFEPNVIRAPLFDFQKAAVEFCIRRGRAALFLDTGLGKTICELEFAAQCAERSNGTSLILTPLAVARQIEREAARFGYLARVVRDQTDVGIGINICNYDRLDRIDPSTFGCVVLDESSILKSFMGKTTRALINSFADTPYRLAATATPAPNDHIELGTHAEFLGVMTQSEMLVRWFINDTMEASQSWRLKGHAVEPFWNWCASWAVMAESPTDLGFDGSRFILPPLNIIRHRAAATAIPTDGLFGFDVSATAIHDLKRQTAEARAEAVAAIIRDSPAPWLIWCDTNYEADSVRAMVPDVTEIRGSMDIDEKESGIAAFLAGATTRLLTKQSICGYGLNLQFCRDMIFVGRSFSYEAWYQAVRRCWRFGQTQPVNVHIIVAEGEDQIGRVIDRKAEDHETMKAAMRVATRRNFAADSAVRVTYEPKHEGRLPAWL